MDFDVGSFTPNSKSRKHQKRSRRDWMDFEEPVIAPVMGMRGGGKGGMMDYMAQRYFDEYFTVLHIWAARSGENLYWMINKDCGLHFRKIKQLLTQKFIKLQNPNGERIHVFSREEKEFYQKLAIQGGFLELFGSDFQLTKKGSDLIRNMLVHCTCDRAIPILLVAPDYVDFDQNTVDRFNGVFWKDMNEYKQHLSEIKSDDKQLLLQGKLKKPSYLRSNPLIKIRKITIPTTEARKEKFRKEWTDAVLQAREEHRPLIITPLMFEGMDKFEVISEIFKYHKTLVNMSGHFKPLTESDVGKERKYWSKKQKNWHKIAIFMNEARSVTPSSKMHGETGAGKSKRSVYDLVPEMRHMKTWYHTDFQNPSDIYDGIRPQSNFVIIKQTSPNLAGGDWKWLFERIETDRFGFMRRLTRGRCDDTTYLRHYEKKFPQLKDWIDQRRPRISELSPDMAYVVWENNEFTLVRNGMGRFHHKLSLEDVMLDTGIRWTVNMEKKPEAEEPKGKKELKEERSKKKQMKQLIFNKMNYLREVEKKNWNNILDDLIQMEKDGIVYGFDFNEKDGKWCSDKFRSWKKTFESIPA
ncbi:MAG: hypothetical protein K8Q89_09375 [Nitrosarchaeum sp.]|nr:hypothetical protein [Nitrosarchaeum sp.]